MLTDKDFTRLGVAALATIIGFAGIAELPGRIRIIAAVIGFGGLGALTFMLAAKLIGRRRPAPLHETDTLRLARESGGILTPTTLALGCNIPLDEAEQTLDYLAGRGVCHPEATDDGVVEYCFPEFLPTDAK